MREVQSRAEFRFAVLFTLALAVTIPLAAQAAPTPAQKCEAGKNSTAGKYAACLHKAQQKFVSGGEVNTAGRDAAVLACGEKYSGKWQSLEAKAGSSVCPSEGDESAIQDFIDACVFSAEDALGGGTLPSDVVICNADLGTCTGNLGTCTGDLGTCTADLGTCTGGTAALGDVLGGKTFSSSAGLGVAGTMANNGAVTLTPTTSDQAIAAGYHNGAGNCAGDADLVSASIKTGVNIFGVAGSVIEASGNAAAGDVLTGTTFSNATAAGISGTMPNVGQQTITPGIVGLVITQGYHDGTGYCAGDPDLQAGNIRNGVDVFGVTGTVQPPPLKTGETSGYGAGSDGNLQKGASRSYTDNGDGTITDNTTGLMWEKKSDDGTIHDKDNMYTWGMATSPYTMNGTMVTTFLAALNAGDGFAEHTDWRIPNRIELDSLLNLQNVNPAVDTAFNTGCVPSCTVLTCSCTTSYGHWSSTTYQLYPDLAWTVGFFDGMVGGNDKAGSYYVRAVRGGL